MRDFILEQVEEVRLYIKTMRLSPDSFRLCARQGNVFRFLRDNGVKSGDFFVLKPCAGEQTLMDVLSDISRMTEVPIGKVDIDELGGELYVVVWSKVESLPAFAAQKLG